MKGIKMKMMERKAYTAFGETGIHRTKEFGLVLSGRCEQTLTGAPGLPLYVPDHSHSATRH